MALFILLLCRQIFCDFGDDFTVTDTDGEQPVSVLISAVTKVSSITWLQSTKYTMSLANSAVLVQSTRPQVTQNTDN